MKQLLRISVPAIAALMITGTGLALAGNHGGQGHGQSQGMGQGMGSGMMMDDRPMMGSGMGRQHGAMMMMQPDAVHRLQLNAEQRERMREMRREHMADRAAQQARMMELREEMHDLMAADRPDPDEIEALHGRMASEHGRVIADEVRMNNAMHDLLTEEQRERMQEMQSRGTGMQGGQGQGQRGQGQRGQGQGQGNR